MKRNDYEIYHAKKTEMPDGSRHEKKRAPTAARGFRSGLCERICIAILTDQGKSFAKDIEKIRSIWDNVYKSKKEAGYEAKVGTEPK